MENAAAPTAQGGKERKKGGKERKKSVKT